MNQSKIYIPTKKNVAKTDVKSHELLLKAGYVEQSASGIYTYLPLATKVLVKIENIIKEELDNIGANEIRMPFLQISDLWEESGRWQNYGDELFRVKDRHGREFALAPTHEEVATDLIKNYLNSYKKLPLNLYQIQTKMRDERRPRFGLLRGREFIMLDGYAFCETEESLKEIYDDYYNAYLRIFDRLGLNVKVVSADNGSMGGNYSHEFMALSEVGEDDLAVSDDLDIAYNVEIAPVNNEYVDKKETQKQEEILDTPNAKTINDLEKNYGFKPEQMLKAVLYDIDGELVICFVMSNRKVQEHKVINYIGGEQINPASENLIIESGLTPGFIGPKNLPEGIKVLYDREIQYYNNFVVGGGEEDKHIVNFNFTEEQEKNNIYIDIRTAEAGDILKVGTKPIKIIKGIEIGHIFALGKKYTESMGVNYLNKDQKAEIPTMGSFGIGVSRLLATIVEQNSLEDKINFPSSVSPYDLHIIPLNYQDESQKKICDEIIEKLQEKSITYLLDDRKERAGIKFNDADLIGINKKIIIGKKAVNGIVEYYLNGYKEEIKIEKIFTKINDY